MSDHPLHSAIRRNATLTSDQLEAVSIAFTEVGYDQVLLADRLKSLGVITQYQFRKIQIGRTSELMFGKFFICERIGEGGMGKVYRALSPTGLEVALKTIRPNLMANKTVVERYKREARAAASLEHPNIVKLIEADDADGRYYIAMEFVNGCDLSRLTKDLIKDSRTIHPSEAAEYIRQAALGLQHSHDRNLIHRDIKPSNLLVCGERALPNTGGKAILKILDMGLVRSLAEEEEGATELTRDGTVVGTPDYMSPEQAKNSSNVDHRADIYSLGCTLYFLLKGGAPFPDGTAIDKLIRHQLDPVPDIRQFRADVSPGLASVIRKMMSKKPIDRFQSCSEVAKELALYTEEGATFDFGSHSAKPSYDLVDLNPNNDRTPVSSQSRGAVIAQQQQTATATKRRVLKAVNEISPAAKSDAAAETPQQTERQKLPKPIAKPQPDQNPSGDIPGSTTAKKSGETKAESIPTKPKRPTATPASAPSNKPKKPITSIGWPIILGAIIGVIAMSGLVVLAVLMANSKTTPSTNTTPPTPQTLLPQPPMAGMTLVADLVPDNTAAVFVVNPKPYWDKLKYETIVGQHLKDYGVMLHRFWNFDPWRFDRVTVALESNPKRFFAIGEGDLLKKTEDFRRDLNDIKRLNTITEADGTLFLREKLSIGNKRDDTRAIFLPKPLAYFIGTPTVNLSEILKNLRGRANGLKNPRLNTVIGDAGNVANANINDPYLAYFAATGEFQFHQKPGSSLTSLTSHGVEVLTAKVTLIDGNFRVSVTAHGTNEKLLSTFLEHELPDVFEQHDREEGGKEIAKLIRLATEHSTTSDLQQYKSRTIQFEVDWLVAHQFLAKMIDTPATTLKK